MNDAFLLSIVVPAFRKQAQLPRLLQSLFTGAPPDSAFEVIVVDDASPDETLAVAAAWAARHPESVRVLRHLSNRGVHAARNTGIAAARGAWVAFLDADDYLVPGGLARVLAVLAAQGDPQSHAESESFRDDAPGAPAARGDESFDVVFFGYETDAGEPTGFARPGAHDVEELFTGEAFLGEKTCLMAARAARLRAFDIAWYYTHLDSLFWREVVYRARGRRALSVTPAVGVYDTTTAGSLKKLRADAAHVARHADAKVAAVLRFVGRTEEYLVTAPRAAEAVARHLLLDNLKHARTTVRVAAATARWAWRLPLSAGLRFKLLAVLVMPAAIRRWWFRRRAGGAPRPSTGP